MNICVTLLAAVFAAPAFAGGALESLGGAESVKAAPVPAVAPAAPAQDKAAAAWSDEVKKAYRQQLESGRLFSLPEVKKTDLPYAAQKQLERDNKPAKTASAYKLTVKNKPAYVVHNRKDGRSLAAHIFEARGKLVAVAKATASYPLYWEDLSSYTSSGGGAGYYGPDDVWDGLGGQGGNYGGPDDTNYGGGGCGDPGGWNGNSGGPDDTNYGGI